MKKYLKDKFDPTNKTAVSVVDELPFWSAPFGKTLLGRVKMKPAMNVLDIGCGTGFPIIELAGRLGDTSNLFGVDPWKTATDRIKLKLKTYKIKNVALINCVAEELPFNNEFFDLIVSNNGINNVQDIKKVLSECYRVLKPKGQFVFTVNLYGTMAEFYDIFKMVLLDLGMNDEIQKMKEHMYEKRKPVKVMDKFVQKAGFEKVKKDKRFFSMRYLNGTTFLNHYPIKLHFLPEWKKILPEKKVEEIFDILENKLNEYAKQNRELFLTIPYMCYIIEK